MHAAALHREPLDEHSWHKTTPSPVSRVLKAQNDSVLLDPAECECRGGSCDPRTGECTCPSGLTGKQCDVCLREHEILVANGPDSMKCEGLYPMGKRGGKPGRGAVLTALFPCSV